MDVSPLRTGVCSGVQERAGAAFYTDTVTVGKLIGGAELSELERFQFTLDQLITLLYRGSLCFQGCAVEQSDSMLIGNVLGEYKQLFFSLRQ